NNTATSFTSAGLYSNTSSSGSQEFVQSVRYVFANGDAVENNANFGFRFVAVFDPVNGSNYISANTGAAADYRTTGTTRFDMVQVASVPEPSSFILGGALCGGLGLRMLRRRKASHAAA
ncbi:MAG: PEP-CTERM sorting domain-containing protein, partial [Planctomycetota bacterium]